MDAIASVEILLLPQRSKVVGRSHHRSPVAVVLWQGHPEKTVAIYNEQGEEEDMVAMISTGKQQQQQQRSFF
jgi:hypothetical protein